MLCHPLRMMERENEFMALHGEDTPQAVRSGLQIGREMG
jgi:hypothetical protein